MTFINETTLQADEGMVLTNSTTFGVIVYLGKNDSADNWHEITKEEAERLQNEEVPTEEPTLEQKAHAYDILTGVIE